ncbi:MAPEG family protein [Xenophilus arseniciresistens]|uniref:MAPEG family protein n=1 Tax=Xenophilus arseniciresistens TaxID=1283306 RepID=A0AAE3N799_9BURK|nr:MAPEG family protein [Xenophilus arseniciresistens]MDA7416193.1 MAPEG family protein [Xenophilus arseniciresistens]
MSFTHLSLAHWCLIAAAVLPFVAAWIAKAGAFRPRDNLAPREWAVRQGGWRARGLAAQANSFEGLPLFFAAVLAAQQLGADMARVDALALAYVLLRVVYIALYLRGLGTARSLVWVLALAVNLAIFFVAPVAR